LFIIALRVTAVQSTAATVPGRGRSEVHAEAVASTTAATSARNLPPFTTAVSSLPALARRASGTCAECRLARVGRPMCARAYVPVFTNASPVPILKSTMILLARATLAS
jgi:hypothetical protein